MNVIGHDFHCKNLAVQFRCLCSQQLAEIFFHRAGKNLPSPFRAPHKMVVKKKNHRVGVFI